MENINIELLDVTLRDGGYKTNFHFHPNIVQNVLTLLDQAGIAYIEVGYRNGPLKVCADMGKAATCPSAYLEYCKRFVQKAKLTVIFHPNNIQLDDLAEMHNYGVDAVRICFSAHNPSLTYEAIEMAKEYNFDVFVNITRVTYHAEMQIKAWVNELKSKDIKAIYLADSNGSMTPERVSNLFSLLKEDYSMPFGFHAHDNLFLAQANAIAAIKQGVQFIDASLFGFGKGTGNLRTEGIASFLHSNGDRSLDFCKLLNAANYVKNQLIENNQFSIKDIILGVFDLSQDDAAKLGDLNNVNDYYLRALECFHNKVQIGQVCNQI